MAPPSRLLSNLDARRVWPRRVHGSPEEAHRDFAGNGKRQGGAAGRLTSLGDACCHQQDHQGDQGAGGLHFDALGSVVRSGSGKQKERPADWKQRLEKMSL